jgi:hypothetical protein
MPAAYPTNVKTFTTKQPTDTPAASFVNDLQDEVHALSSGLLTGVARLNSSNSTLAALTVPGVSTLGSLQVSSNATIGGTLTVNKIVSTSVAARSLTSYVWAYTDNAPLGSSRVNLPSNSTNSTLTMALNVEFADLLSEYDSTTFRFTPQSSGFYRVEAAYTPAAPSLGIATIQLRVNDTVYVEVAEPMQTGTITGPRLVATVRLSSGQAGQLRASLFSQTSSVLSSGIHANWFRVTRIW